jgi:uncharacterized protein YcbK (DUF882 family)
MSKSYFSDEELRCPCCGESWFSPSFLEILNKIREELGQAMKVNSACRCEKHNKEVGGKPNSQHLLGKAIDIHCPDANYKYRLAQLAFKYGVKGVGVYDTFMHLDYRDGLEVMW